MIEVVLTDTFSEWLDDLRDSVARTKILARIKRLAFGNYGDIEPVGEGVSEMPFTTGRVTASI